MHSTKGLQACVSAFTDYFQCRRTERKWTCSYYGYDFMDAYVPSQVVPNEHALDKNGIARYMGMNV